MSVYSDPYQQGAGQGPYANSYPHMRTGCGLGWKPIELVAMILGFIVFWPIGLAILFAKMWQRKHGYSGDIPSFVKSRLREKWRENWQSKWQEKWETKIGTLGVPQPGFRSRSLGVSRTVLRQCRL